MDKSLHHTVELLRELIDTVEDRRDLDGQTPLPPRPFTPEENEKFYSDRIIVDGQYILRGQYDEELNVHDFYFTPDQIHLVMELLHDRVMSDPDTIVFDDEGNDLLQELTSQVLHHPDNDESVV